MTRHRQVSTIFALTLVFALMVLPVRADTLSPDSGEKSKAETCSRFSYAPIYQLETDMGAGGSFDVQRHFLRFDVTQIINHHWMVGVGLGFDFERWNFSDITAFAGVDLWDELFRPGLSIPIFYSPGGNWQFGIIPSVEIAGSSGADVSESLSYGSVLSAAYAFGPNLTLGLGAGVFRRLDQTEAFPYIVIDWEINSRLRLANPFQAGPVGPVGLELSYTPNDNWEMGLGGAYRSYRFRLGDSSAVTGGIGQVDFWAPFLRLGRKLGQRYQLDINVGATVDGSITIEDENASKIGETDYDTAPFLAVTLKGQF